MKGNLLDLIAQIESIESNFHDPLSSPGLLTPSVEIINDIPEFNTWIQQVQFELQDIANNSGDLFIIATLECAKQNYDGWNDRKYFAELKGKLWAIRANIDKYYPNSADSTKVMKAERKPRIFISHASKDKAFVGEVVSLLETMGLRENDVFCSSLPGYDVPIGNNIFDYLREQFLEYDLHVLFVHSPNYYASPVSLNEMGAAWALKANCTSLLLPDFTFEEMKGVVNSNTIAIKLDSDEYEVKDKLDQLYEVIRKEFGLTARRSTTWEQKRDSFIQSIRDIKMQSNKQAPAKMKGRESLLNLQNTLPHKTYPKDMVPAELVKDKNGNLGTFEKGVFYPLKNGVPIEELL